MPSLSREQQNEYENYIKIKKEIRKSSYIIKDGFDRGARKGHFERHIERFNIAEDELFDIEDMFKLKLHACGPLLIKVALSNLIGDMVRIDSVISSVIDEVTFDLEIEEQQGRLDKILLDIEQRCFKARKSFLEKLPMIESTWASHELQTSGGLTSAKKEFNTIINGLRREVEEKVTRDYAETFRERALQHRYAEHCWGAGLLVGLVVLTFVLVWIFQSTAPVAATEFAFFVSKRILAISLLGTVIKVCLTRHGMERNLRILYEHRHTVLGQYKVFNDNTINKTGEHHNQFLLEVTRLIFSDPATGYIPTTAAPEINVGTIAGALSRVGKKP